MIACSCPWLGCYNLLDILQPKPIINGPLDRDISLSEDLVAQVLALQL